MTTVVIYTRIVHIIYKNSSIRN